MSLDMKFEYQSKYNVSGRKKIVNQNLLVIF